MTRNMKIRTLLALSLLVSFFGVAWGNTQNVEATGNAGAVYAMTNEPTGNRIVVYNRAKDGTLTQAGSFLTGGLGSGTIENSANGIILTNADTEQAPNNFANGTSQFLFATNTASNSISVFRVSADNLLNLVETKSSEGLHPISVTYHNHILYVLNGGTTNCTAGNPTIAGFKVSEQGNLTAIAGSVQPVSGGLISGCAQISFNPAGNLLSVSQRQADKIDTFLVDANGQITRHNVNETSGFGPFGLTYTTNGVLVTTENFAAAPLLGGVASYKVFGNGSLRAIGTTQGNYSSDTCWIVITDDQQYAYLTNFQSGNISSFRVLANGQLQLLNSVAAFVGIGASDEAFSLDSRYLYVRDGLGRVVAWQVEADGSLTFVQSIGGLLPGGSIGIAAK